MDLSATASAKHRRAPSGGRSTEPLSKHSTSIAAAAHAVRASQIVEQQCRDELTTAMAARQQAYEVAMEAMKRRHKLQIVAVRDRRHAAVRELLDAGLAETDVCALTGMHADDVRAARAPSGKQEATVARRRAGSERFPFEASSRDSVARAG